MRILYIDTSSSFLYAGIAEDNNLLAEVKKEFGTSLSEEALPITNLKTARPINLKPYFAISAVNTAWCPIIG